MLDYGDITARPVPAGDRSANLRLKPGKLYTRIREPYFFSYVRDQLIAEYGVEHRPLGRPARLHDDQPAPAAGGAKAIKDTLYLRNDPAAAVVSINPANGAIRAMTAVTPGRTGNQFNLVAQARRQPGSTFKVFVLDRGDRRGHEPGLDLLRVRAVPLPARPVHRRLGRVDLRPRLLRLDLGDQRDAASDNTVYAQLTLDVGPDKVAEMAHRLGIQSTLDVVPAMGLGSDAISPLEEASAYATLAAGGIYSKPMAIRKVILANGKVDTDAGWGKPQRKRVISDGVAYEVTKILEDNVLGGTGVGAYFGRPAAGKTGTTDNHADAWFSGYVPQLETTVWVGYPQGEIPMENVHGVSVQGGTFPATIWRLFMEAAMAKHPALDWRQPLNPASGGRSRRGNTRRASRRRPRRRPADHDYDRQTTTAARRRPSRRRRRRPRERSCLHPRPRRIRLRRRRRPRLRRLRPRHHRCRSVRAGAARRARRDPDLPGRVRRSGRRPLPRRPLPRPAHLPGLRRALLHGELPYRDVFVEYPPGAFAVFLPPTAFGSGHYNAAFKCLMALCGVATLVLVALVLAELGASRAASTRRVGLLALSPVALGPISLNTYDAWPALLTVLALWLFLRERDVLGFAVLGLAITAKVYPLVLVPLALAFVWRRAGPRRVALGLERCSSSPQPLSRPSPPTRRTGSSRASARRPSAGCRSRAWAPRSCSCSTGSASTTRRS